MSRVVGLTSEALKRPPKYTDKWLTNQCEIIEHK